MGGWTWSGHSICSRINIGIPFNLPSLGDYIEDVHLQLITSPLCAAALKEVARWLMV